MDIQKLNRLPSLRVSSLLDPQEDGDDADSGQYEGCNCNLIDKRLETLWDSSFETPLLGHLPKVKPVERIVDHSATGTAFETIFTSLEEQKLPSTCSGNEHTSSYEHPLGSDRSRENHSHKIDCTNYTETDSDPICPLQLYASGKIWTTWMQRQLKQNNHKPMLIDKATFVKTFAEIACGRDSQFSTFSATDASLEITRNICVWGISSENVVLFFQQAAEVGKERLLLQSLKSATPIINRYVKDIDEDRIIVNGDNTDSNVLAFFASVFCLSKHVRDELDNIDLAALKLTQKVKPTFSSCFKFLEMTRKRQELLRTITNLFYESAFNLQDFLDKLYNLTYNLVERNSLRSTHILFASFCRIYYNTLLYNLKSDRKVESSSVVLKCLDSIAQRTIVDFIETVKLAYNVGVGIQHDTIFESDQVKLDFEQSNSEALSVLLEKSIEDLNISSSIFTASETDYLNSCDEDWTQLTVRKIQEMIINRPILRAYSDISQQLMSLIWNPSELPSFINIVESIILFKDPYLVSFVDSLLLKEIPKDQDKFQERELQKHDDTTDENSTVHNSLEYSRTFSRNMMSLVVQPRYRSTTIKILVEFDHHESQYGKPWIKKSSDFYIDIMSTELLRYTLGDELFNTLKKIFNRIMEYKFVYFHMKESLATKSCFYRRTKTFHLEQNSLEPKSLFLDGKSEYLSVHFLLSLLSASFTELQKQWLQFKDSIRKVESRYRSTNVIAADSPITVKNDCDVFIDFRKDLRTKLRALGAIFFLEDNQTEISQDVDEILSVLKRNFQADVTRSVERQESSVIKDRIRSFFRNLDRMRANNISEKSFLDLLRISFNFDGADVFTD